MGEVRPDRWLEVVYLPWESSLATGLPSHDELCVGDRHEEFDMRKDQTRLDKNRWESWVRCVERNIFLVRFEIDNSLCRFVSASALHKEILSCWEFIWLADMDIVPKYWGKIPENTRFGSRSSSGNAFQCFYICSVYIATKIQLPYNWFLAWVDFPGCHLQQRKIAENWPIGNCQNCVSADRERSLRTFVQLPAHQSRKLSTYHTD